ncbi:UDP-glucuronosyltransferase 2C1-like [Podarcis raffonei]|uniref:UDP-glucuronosyltransferase 2C1-like n=1 Tax=Podarcis raffonei TaxID=65483 RepID=UPI002329071D|nr:UDP-glucuronosyltransferase 2C1-like [Podarcis raffonei]
MLCGLVVEHQFCMQKVLSISSWGHCHSGWETFLFATMQGKKFLILFWLQVCCWGPSSGGKVLVWPTDGSHWINIKMMLNELALRGHSVTVLIPSASYLIDPKEASSSSYRIEVLPVTFTKEEVLAVVEKFLDVATYELPTLPFWKAMQKMRELVASFDEMSKQVCDSIFHNETRIAMLRKEDFNVLISDPLTPCGDLLAELLGIPFLYTFRFSDGNSMERLCGQLPAPPSYVGASTGGMSDRMSFVERMKNVLFYAFSDGFFLYSLASEWDRYYSEILGKCRQTLGFLFFRGARVLFIQSYGQMLCGLVVEHQFCMQKVLSISR